MPYCVGVLIKLHLLQCQLYSLVKGNGNGFSKQWIFFFVIFLGQFFKKYVREVRTIYMFQTKNKI